MIPHHNLTAVNIRVSMHMFLNLWVPAALHLDSLGHGSQARRVPSSCSCPRFTTPADLQFSSSIEVPCTPDRAIDRRVQSRLDSAVEFWGTSKWRGESGGAETCSNEYEFRLVFLMHVRILC